MMQTTNLPIQISGAAPARPGAAPIQDKGSSFSQSFTQAAQRQAAPQPAAPAPAGKPAAQQAPKQNGAPADKAAASRPSGDASKPAQAAASNDKPPAASAKAAEADRDAADAAQAAANAPVMDMLALVASLNGAVSTPGPGTAQAALPEHEGAASPAAAAPQPLAPLATQPAPDAQGAAEPALAEVADPLQDQQQPRRGAQDLLAANGNAQPARPPLADAADAADSPVQPRFKLPDLQPVAQPQAAPGVATVQQTSMAQAVANASGNQLAARVGTQEWDNQVGQKIVWMVAGKEQSATLTLNPPDLGPMQVVLNVTNDHADVTFTAAQPEVRQALEDAMPRLREMMSESGLSLDNASVNAGMPEQRQAQADAGANGQGRGGRGDAAGGDGDGAALDQGSAAALEERAAARSARTGMVRSLVDTFI